MFADQAVERVGRDVAAAPGDDARFVLGAELDLLDEMIDGYTGTFRENKAPKIRAAGRAQIIESAATGFAQQGRGEAARALLQRDDIAGLLDESTRSRLRRNTEALAYAHDRERIEREKRRIRDEIRAPEAVIKSMPGLTATGGAHNRTVAAPALTALLARTVAARGPSAAGPCPPCRGPGAARP